METIGRIVRLQVQLSSLKGGERPLRRYEPAPLRAVPALLLSAGGVLGVAEDGREVLDVHHRDHPASKNREGVNGISVGFTGHYAAMRARYGPHLGDGIAGENILVETPYSYPEQDLTGGVVIETAGGQTVRLERVVVAEPCVEFSRYALRYDPDARTDRAVTAALTFLGDGMRGYYASYRGEPARIALGDRVSIV
jgi:hypothetical protein